MNFQSTSILKTGAENTASIVNAIGKLPEDEKNVLILRIVKGYSINKVSNIMNESEEYIKHLQLQSLKKLTSILQKA